MKEHSAIPSLILLTLLGGMTFDVYAARPPFKCQGQLVLNQKNQKITCRVVKTSSKAQITCRKKPHQCRLGDIIIHPKCLTYCRRREIGKCWRIKKKQRKSCKKMPAALLVPCALRGKRWRKRCAQEAAKANEACRERASVAPCRRIFNRGRQRCAWLRRKSSKYCKRQLKRRLKKCKILGRRALKKRLAKCGERFNRCINYCVGRSWPCRKRCFLKRHRCLNNHRDLEYTCRDTAARLRVECSIASDKKQARCVKKAELKMYHCMQQLSRKRILCIIDVGRQYRRCIKTVQYRQLLCFFKQMDYKYLCSGAAYKDCRRALTRKIKRCTRQICPRCRIMR